MVRTAATVACFLLLAGCGSSARTARTDRREPQGPRVFAALAPLPGGGLRAGDLRSGVITDVLGAHAVRLVKPRMVARVRVSTGGQRGLLGLAVDGKGRTFAAYTAPTGNLVVAQVAPGSERIVWDGPRSTALADGGHLAFARDGLLLIGIGDLQNPPAVVDRATSNGKLLALNPDGPPDQRPQVLSLGWNNPYAFAVTAAGRVIVADNAPGERPERIADGSGGGQPRDVTNLPARIAPSGLAVTGADEIAVCGVRSGELTRYTRSAAGRWRQKGTISACRYGVAALSDGRLAVSGDNGIEVLTP